MKNPATDANKLVELASSFRRDLDCACESYLTWRETAIIRSRFGLDGGELQPLPIIARHHKISRDKVSHLIQKGLAKISRRAANQLKKGQTESFAARLTTMLQTQFSRSDVDQASSLKTFAEYFFGDSSRVELASELFSGLFENQHTIGSVEADASADPIDDIARHFLVTLDLAANSALTERQATIIRLRFGLDNREYHTLRPIGCRFGISKERVRQIIQSCCRKLRQKGDAYLRHDEVDRPCAALLTAVEQLFKSPEVTLISRSARFVELAFGDLSHAALCFTLFKELARERVSPKRVQFTEQGVLHLLRERESQVHSMAQADRLNRLLDFVVWPGEPRTGDWSSFRKGRCRDIRDRDEYSGFFASPKNACEVWYESLAELSFFEMLEVCPIVRSYQEQPAAIPYTAPDGPHQYFPDAFVLLSDGRGLLAEVKPRHAMALSCNWVKWAAMRDYARERGLGFLITDGRVALQQLGTAEVKSRRFREVLTQATAAGPLDWTDYRAIYENNEGNWEDFLGLVVSQKLNWSLSPFRLSRQSYG